MALSRVGQPMPAFGNRTVGWLIDRDRADDRRFLTWQPFEGDAAHWSRRQFARDVHATAAELQHRGVGAGDRVLLMLDNDPAFLIAWSATLLAGAVAVCLNTRASTDEIGYYGQHSEAVAAIAHTDYAELLGAAVPSLRWLAPVSRGDTATLAMSDPDAFRPTAIEPEAMASIQYTSGTTARPKAVVWTHQNCLWAARTNAAHQRLSRDDVNLIHLPLFHTNGLGYSFLGSLWAGSRIVLQPRFSASRFWEVSVLHRATWSSVVSFCVKALTGRDAPTDHSYRGWANSYEIPGDDGPGGVVATGWFGMTETLSHPILTDPGQPMAAGSMGVPAPEYRVRIVDDDDRNVATGEVGNLLVGGVPGLSLFDRYLHDEAATAKVFTANGWFRTGDRVRSDRSGHIFFVERDSDVLKVGGENIGALEIERVLLAVPGVRQAAVVGLADHMLGEVPVAFVTSSEDPILIRGAIEEHCARMLPAFKRPRAIHLVQNLPLSTLNKVAKAELRRRAAATAGP